MSTKVRDSHGRLTSDEVRFADLQVQLADVESRMRRTAKRWAWRRRACSLGRNALRGLAMFGGYFMGYGAGVQQSLGNDAT